MSLSKPIKIYNNSIWLMTPPPLDNCEMEGFRSNRWCSSEMELCTLSNNKSSQSMGCHNVQKQVIMEHKSWLILWKNVQTSDVIKLFVWQKRPSNIHTYVWKYFGSFILNGSVHTTKVKIRIPSASWHPASSELSLQSLLPSHK